jgi:two-component system, chemotaxis family, protein-glutamate methylesterase/glutaminase
MTQVSKDNSNKQDSSGFAGTLRNIQITDIIQMCCLAGASLCIRVTQDNDRGTIYIEDGEVVHAECGRASGVNAFFTILGWPSGQFETMEAPAIGTPTIKEPCQFLLMEAARQADEWATAREEPELAEPELFEPEKIKVLIVDDSPIMSKILTSMLAADGTIEVIGTAKNGEEALKMMKSLTPDLITMDVNMPVMDGSTALKHIMIGSPCPVIIMSNLAPSSYDTLLSFLNLGAVDFMSKPVKSSNIVVQQQRIVDRIHQAAKADVKRFQLLRCPKLKPSDFVPVNKSDPCEMLVVAVSGAGGYLETVNMITGLPGVTRTTVLSLQSIPPPFAPTLSSYLNMRSRFDVQPLVEKGILNPGLCYIANSSLDMQFAISDGRLALFDNSAASGSVNSGSIDRLLLSAAELFQDRVLVLLLSGADVGDLEGLHAIRAAGGKILAPKPDRCILPASIEPAMAADLVGELFDPANLHKVLVSHCK